MLFITSRVPKQDPRSVNGHKFIIDPDDPAVTDYIYFCERFTSGNYVELKSVDFFQRLSTHSSILLYIHGFNSKPETDVFPNVISLQKKLEVHCKPNNTPLVIPLLWPCQHVIAAGQTESLRMSNHAAHASGQALVQMLRLCYTWARQQKHVSLRIQVIKLLRNIDVLTISTGITVLQSAIKEWVKDETSNSRELLTFKTIFTSVMNQRLKQPEAIHQQVRQYIPKVARNLVVLNTTN